MQASLFNDDLAKKYSFYYSNKLNNEQIQKILDYLRYIYRYTPLFTPTIRSGQPYSIQITSMGRYGWMSDEKGYYYSDVHPNGNTWREIPNWLYDLVQEQLDLNNLKFNAKNYDSCLINYYKQNSKLGMHIDNTEKDMETPIISFSIGATAKFDIEFGLEKSSYLLENGSVVIMAGLSRYAKHGVSKIVKDENFNFLKESGSRLNLTFRKTGL